MFDLSRRLHWSSFVAIASVSLGLAASPQALSFQVSESSEASSPAIELDYTVSGCEDVARKCHNPALPVSFVKPLPQPTLALDPVDPAVTVDVKEGRIHFIHEVYYTCCARIVLDWSVRDGAIDIVERNEGEACRCMCSYQVQGEIGPLESGNYQLRVQGITGNYHPEQTVTVP